MTATDSVDPVRVDGTDGCAVGRSEGRALPERFHAIAFWLLAIFLLGACAGIGAAFKYHSTQLDRSIHLGSFVHDGVVYEVTPKAPK